MTAKLVAFATCDWPGYSSLQGEERDALPHLKKLGIQVQHPVWDDKGVQWKQFAAVIIRSTWDYPRKLAQFQKWIQHCEDLKVPLYNPTPILKWNLDKAYLKEIEKWGFAIVPTHWITFTTEKELTSQVNNLNWPSVIVKPTISNGAFNTVLVKDVSSPTHYTFSPGTSLMVQPFWNEIATDGEWSFVFIGGNFSHCVRKIPKKGDFRVQLHHGGRYSTEKPPADGLAFAERLFNKIDSTLLYGRIDLVRKNNAFHVMEVELIEPSLYLDYCATAPEKLARAIADKCR